MSKKKISFYKDKYKNNLEIYDSSIGDLLIKLLEINPI